MPGSLGFPKTRRILKRQRAQVLEDQGSQGMIRFLKSPEHQESQDMEGIRSKSSPQVPQQSLVYQERKKHKGTQRSLGYPENLVSRRLEEGQMMLLVQKRKKM